jgi:thymidylate kinase
MHALAAYAPRPTILFLIDCDPAICRDRMIARGRPVSYFERGARIVGELHQPMTEGDPAIRGSADGAVPLLGHLVRMRDALGQRMADYDTVMVVDNEGSPDAAFETIMEAIDAVDRNRDASRIAAVSRAG